MESIETKKTLDPVPYLAHEAALAREERHTWRLWIALLITISLLFISNLGWLYCWMQYDYVSDTYTATQDGEGVNIIGGGDVSYGSEADAAHLAPD